MISQKTPTSTTSAGISIVSSPTSPGFSSSAAFGCAAPQLCTKWQDRLIGKPHHENFGASGGKQKADDCLPTFSQHIARNTILTSHYSKTFPTEEVNNTHFHPAQCLSTTLALNSYHPAQSQFQGARRGTKVQHGEAP